jgi:hypothetical protein
VLVFKWYGGLSNFLKIIAEIHGFQINRDNLNKRLSLFQPPVHYTSVFVFYGERENVKDTVVLSKEKEFVSTITIKC